MPNKNHAKTKLVRKFFSSSNLIWYALGLVVVVVILAITTFSQSPTKKPSSLGSSCGPYRNDKSIQINSETINAEIPNSTDAYAKGLGGRPCILPNQAMLFVFSKPGQYPIWMKGMKFPIDIVWLNKDFKVVGYYNNVKPSTYPDRFVNEKELPAQYVLELKAGRVSELHISKGTTVQF